MNQGCRMWLFDNVMTSTFLFYDVKSDNRGNVPLFTNTSIPAIIAIAQFFS